jgi:hypothetical protein
MHLENAVVATLRVKIGLQFAPPSKHSVTGATLNQGVVLHVIGYAQIDRSAVWAFKFVVEALTHLTHSNVNPIEITPNFALLQSYVRGGD